MGVRIPPSPRLGRAEAAKSQTWWLPSAIGSRIAGAAGGTIAQRIGVRLAQAEHGCTMASAAGFHLGGTVYRLRRFARGAMEPTSVPIVPAPAPAEIVISAGCVSVWYTTQ